MQSLLRIPPDQKLHVTIVIIHLYGLGYSYLPITLTNKLVLSQHCFSRINLFIAGCVCQMSVTEDVPDMDGADLLGILFQEGEPRANDPFFPYRCGLENWLSEQDVCLPLRNNTVLCLLTDNSLMIGRKQTFNLIACCTSKAEVVYYQITSKCDILPYFIAGKLYFTIVLCGINK